MAKIEEKQLVGVVLRVHPYGENSWIVTLWTESMGKIGLYVNKSNASLWVPPNQVEVVALCRSTGLSRCREVRLVWGFPGLRNDLERIKACGILLGLLNRTQPDERPSSSLYNLFIDYLHRLEAGIPPLNIVTSFYLKLLRYEGFWGDRLHCATCCMEAMPIHIGAGDSWCEQHAPCGTIAIDAEAWDQLLRLAYCKNSAELAAINVDNRLISMTFALLEVHFPSNR